MKYALLFALFSLTLYVSAQTPSAGRPARMNFASQGSDPFGTRKVFIQNTGQYDVLQETYKTDKVLFGYEGLDMPVLLTITGLVHVERKFTPKEDEEEREEREREKRKGKAHEESEEEEERWIITDNAVSMKWTGANAAAVVTKEEPLPHYFSYGSLPTTANGFKKISYGGFYPGIDLHYFFTDADKPGLQFSLALAEGADANLLRWTYTGDVKKIRKDGSGNLRITSSAETTVLSAPKAFYADEPGHRIRVEFNVSGNTVRFAFPDGYDRTRKIVIDPFVSNTTNLTGTNARIAKDMDFDYNGNVYVSGGGNASVFQLAKYDAAGILQWTFNGGPIVISGSNNWSFGTNYGGFVLEKSTGKIYLSQGWNFTTGVKVVRLTTGGTYDNYVTTPNIQFSEGWRMFWDCSGTTGQMLVAGGGSTSNLDFGIFAPPSTVMTTQNITGLSSHSQDIADAVIDPRNHEMYTLFSAGHVPPNNLYKHGAPYRPADIKWNKGTGFPTVLGERVNRPYLVRGTLDDNSINSLAINATYLFYWDGKNLKAISKATGDAVGATLTTADTVLRQGGIVADECGNVFVGTRQGLIKVYKFNGTAFDDAAAPDLTVAGFTAVDNSVYDLAYDDVGKVLYACGRGFVASFDVTPYCVQATYTLKLIKDCALQTVTAQLQPSPPAGSTVTYVLLSGGTQIASNATGLFTGLTLGTAYTVKVLVNEACSGIQQSADFVFGQLKMAVAKTPACGSNGTVTVTASDGEAPYSYSLNGGRPQASGTFSNLAVGSYAITAKDALGCTTALTIAVEAGIGCVTATVTKVDEKCSLLNGSITVTASAGTPPYMYSIDGTNFQTGNVFANLAAGNYTVTVRDASGGTFTVPVTLLSLSNDLIGFTFTTTTATCANNNGSITATGTGGALPYEYKLNNGAYQSSGTFNGLASGNYTVTVRDVNGCSFSQPVTVPLNNDLSVDAGNGQTVCQGDSVLLNALSNGSSFVWSPTTGLSAATILRPKAAPSVTTMYYLTAQTGPCTARDSVEVVINPAPVPVAFDTTICYGQSVTLRASGGSNYTWSPSTYLSSTTAANPVVTKPASTITYTLSAVGVNGCASINPDRVTVTVQYRLQLLVTSDTVALENEPLQLNAIDRNNTTPINWLWTPSTGLSNPTIQNPIFVSASDKSYLLTAVTPDGCEARDSVRIKVYRFAEIFVPTAFSPNNDGRNDLLKAVPVGIRQFRRFAVYNRWGQMVFSTTDAGKGWDGTIAGVPQGNAAFVWMASGIDFKGRLIERKGTTVLIR